MEILGFLEILDFLGCVGGWGVLSPHPISYHGRSQPSSSVNGVDTHLAGRPPHPISYHGWSQLSSDKVYKIKAHEPIKESDTEWTKQAKRPQGRPWSSSPARPTASRHTARRPAKALQRAQATSPWLDQLPLPPSRTSLRLEGMHRKTEPLRGACWKVCLCRAHHHPLNIQSPSTC